MLARAHDIAEERLDVRAARIARAAAPPTKSGRLQKLAAFMPGRRRRRTKPTGEELMAKMSSLAAHFPGMQRTTKSGR